jgi:NADH-quinone oxidoreductase subunit G
VLRVLGNLLDLPGFDYLSSEDIREEIRRELAESPSVGTPPASGLTLGRLAAVDSSREVGIYRVDAVVRRSRSLQQTVDGREDADGGRG